MKIFTTNNILAAVVIFSLNAALYWNYQVYAQQEESDGGLTAALSAATYLRGQSVSVTGTVEDRDDNPTLYIITRDPDGVEIDTDAIIPGVDGNFRYGFVPDEGRKSEMTRSGTYSLEVRNFGEGEIESVTLEFEYVAEAPAPTPQSQQQTQIQTQQQQPIQFRLFGNHSADTISQVGRNLGFNATVIGQSTNPDGSMTTLVRAEPLNTPRLAEGLVQ